MHKEIRHYIVEWKRDDTFATHLQRFDTIDLAQEFRLDRLEQSDVTWATVRPMTEYEYQTLLFRRGLWAKKAGD